MKPTANTKEIKDYQKLMKKFPGIVRHATKSALNTQAFAMKNTHIPESLEKNFTVRSPKFLKRQTKVIMAKPGKEVENNFAIVGMETTDRFSGLEEQQTGQASKKRRTATTDISRGGSFSKKQRPTTRMKPGSFRRQSQYKGRTKKHRFFNMIRETRKQKLNFIVSRGLGNMFNLPAGLYGWKGNKLKMLQSFRATTPDKKDWMGDAIKGLRKHRGPFTRVFIAEMERLIEKEAKR